ncbi:MAG: DUF1592 domain-containing protein [Myxococcota bacterium]
MRVKRSVGGLARVAALALLSAVACSRATGGNPPPRADSGRTNPNPNPDPDGGTIVTGETGQEIYQRRCQSCHGAQGEGIAQNPALNRYTRGRDAMIAAISARMPQESPGSCQGACATDVTDYILGSLQVSTSTMTTPCTAPARWPRQLRLLTAREYQASVRDLFQPELAAPRSCADDNACAIATESCVASVCAADPCTRRTFLYAPSTSHSTVLVAGSFNGWASTAAAGAWPMQQSGGRWILKHDLPLGRYEYKLIVDGNWITDPGNSSTAPDGFGGQNSVLDTSACSASGPSAVQLDLAPLVAAFPPENRPRGFVFDNDSSSRVMGSSRMDAELNAAKSIAHQVAPQSSVWLSCDHNQVAACAQAFVSGLARRAYRRPLTSAESTKLITLITAGAQSQGLDHGLELGIRAVLASPSFLYRSELGVVGGDGVARLDGYETASLLSYFFWGTLPDQALLAAAERGDLSDPMKRADQARRLLADPRAAEGLGGFALGWLGVERILTADKRADLFPELDPALRQDMLTETKTFFAEVVLRGSGRYTDVLTADYSYLSDRLARLYGLSGAGNGFSKIAYGMSGRSGILSHASVLGSYAYSDTSAPVRRGVFVRERLLCQSLPIPPPGAGALPAVDPSATTRERFRQHSDSPNCRGCHALIDPVGFGFERFDAIGKRRDTENGQPIDTSGDLTDADRVGAGTHLPFDGIGALGQLLATSAGANACFARQMWRFAKGGLEAETDRCGVAAAEQGFIASGGDVRALMVSIAASQAFVERAP